MKLFRAVQDGKVAYLSPEPIDTTDFSPDYFSPDCSFDTIQLDVPTVAGVLELWDGNDGKKHPHLHYVCPRCSVEHNVDLNNGDSNPRFACCDSCGWDSVVWIRWSTP